MVFENPHSKKYKKGDGLLTDLFNTSTKLIRDNKDSLLSVISESSKLKDSISKNIDLNKKIAKLDASRRRAERSDAEGGAKLDAEKKKQTEKKLEEEKKQQAMLPIGQTEKPVNVKKEIVKDIITKKKGRGFYDIH